MRALALAALVLTTACGPKHGPRDVLSAYLEAEKVGRYDTAHALLTREDQRARPVDVYAREHLAAGPIWNAVAKRTEFKVGKAVEADDHYVLTVQARHPDLKAVESSLPGVPTKMLAKQPDPKAAMADYVERNMKDSEYPMVEEELTYAVRDEAGAYKVWLGVALQDQAIHHLRAARNARARKDDKAEIMAIERALNVAPDPSGVVEALQKDARARLDELKRPR